jgi:hypothetical protein
MPEITAADPFGRAIIQTIREHGFETVLEIGAWDGAGSTQVFIEALAHAQDPLIVALEGNAVRYVQLVETVRNLPWVKPVLGSSITLASLTPQTFEEVWDSPHNRLRYPREVVRQWWVQTQAFLADAKAGFLECLEGAAFDVVLVDGDEFAGFDDYRLAKPHTKCLMLDDVHNAYKCNRAHAELARDPEWRLAWEDATVRNGAAIWVKTN